MSKEQVWTHFSSLAERGVWASLYEPGTRITAENSSFLIRARRVMELLQASRVKIGHLLDVGCGTAPLGPAVVAMGSRYTGIDFSRDMIESAQQIMKDSVATGAVHLSVGDAMNLELADGSFPAVVAMGLLEYFTREQMPQVMHEIARVLEPGGVAIITIPKKWHWQRVVNAALTPLREAVRWRPQSQLKLAKKEGFKRLYLTPGELDDAACKQGLTKLDHRHYNVQIATGPIVSVAPRLSYVINRPFEWFALLPGSSFFATGYIGMYKKR